MKKNKNNQRNIKIAVLIALILLLVGVIGYPLATSSVDMQNKSTDQTQSDSSPTSKDDISAMMSKVHMKMPRAEVDKIIGSPYECAQNQTSVEKGDQYSMQRCQYGDKNAEYHFDVTYMNGKVWGMAAVKM